MKLLETILDYSDAEFNGKSFNGDSLVATLRKLSPGDAASTATFEGHSAWGVAIHVAYCKHFLATAIAGEEVIGTFPLRAGEDSFGKPDTVDAASWEATLACLEDLHARLSVLLRELDDATAERTIPSWGITLAQALAWYLTHDAYHTAQIRNMGVPGTRKA
ncbi:MAG: DinB family protein [Spirochaetota bacterium]